MTKRIISLVLLTAMIFSCMCFTNTVSADSETYGAEALVHMKNLGILPADTDGDDVVSRAVFAQAVYNLAGKNTNITFEQLYYDVNASDSFATAVMYCSKNGYMVGSDNMFRPDDSITYIEAMTVLARVMNYTEYAKNNGDYTIGYYTTAKNLGLLNNTGIVSSDSPMTAGSCAAMLYNATRIGMNKLSSINPLYYTYQTSSRIFAYETLGYNYAKGVMTSNGYVDVKGKDNVGKNTVVIDNARYSSKLLDDSYKFLIGQEVSIYYDDELNIVSIAPTGVSSAISVKREYFGNKAGNVFTFNTDDNSSKKIEVSDKAIYFKNGEVVMGYNATGFKDAKFGDINFIDGDGDEVYDYVFVNVYNTFVVASIFSDGVLYSRGNTEKLDLSEENTKDIMVYNANGERKSPEDIRVGNVVSVVENEDFIYVIYSNSVIKGELQEKDTYLVKVDGLTIDIPNGTADFLNDIKIGNNVTIYLDFADRGVYATKNIDTTGGAKYGYLVEAKFKDGFEKAARLKMYTLDNEFVYYNLGSLFVVDEVKYRMKNLTSIPDVFYSNGNFRSTVVLYEVNENNEITSITFPKSYLGEDEDGFVQTASSQTAYKISNGALTNTSKKADGTYFSGFEFINSSTKIFAVPKSDLEDEEKYAVITASDVPTSTNYVWDLFHTSKYNGFVDIAVIHNDYAAISYDTRLSVVTSTFRKLDENGTERFAIKHISNGTEYISMADDSFQISDYIIAEDGTKAATKVPVTALKPGDAVRLTTGENGLLRSGERIYEYALENGFKGSSKAGAYATHSLYLNYGYIAYNDNTMVRFAPTKAACTVSTSDLFTLPGTICSSASIMVVKETARGVNVTKGTISDLAIGDHVVYQLRSGLAKYVIVYKDK